MSRLFILHVEDDDGDAFLVERGLKAALRAMTPVILRTSTVREAELLLSRLTVDAIILDLRLPDVFSIDEAIVRMRRAADVPIMVMSDSDASAIPDGVAREQIALFVQKGQLADSHAAARLVSPFFSQLAAA